MLPQTDTVHCIAYQYLQQGDIIHAHTVELQSRMKTSQQESLVFVPSCLGQ